MRREMMNFRDGSAPWMGRLLLMLIALGGGLWSAGGTSALRLLPLTAGLVLAGWFPLWEAMTTTDWAAAFARWQQWTEEAKLPRPPYLREGTPGAQLWHALAAARRWWQAEGSSRIGRPLRQAGLALVAGLMLSAALGALALLMTLLFLALTELATLWHDGHGVEEAAWLALGEAAMPWLLGALLAGSPASSALLHALAVAAVGTAFFTPRLTAILGVLFGGGVLIWEGHPVAAALLLLVAYPPLRFAAVPLPKAEHRRLVLPWLWLAILIIAGV